MAHLPVSKHDCLSLLCHDKRYLVGKVMAKDVVVRIADDLIRLDQLRIQFSLLLLPCCRIHQ